ncbi:hypothetical protein BDC45DRAFT_573482 [Circinella umbellata]|nr:hypothetical protein BDC45DRAFT_573482 [Circinella umbellata]
MPVEKVPIALILDSDKCLRLWVMRPFLAGKHLSFERVLKCEIDPKPMEMAPILSVMKFFWKLKLLLERLVAALDVMKNLMKII